MKSKEELGKLMASLKEIDGSIDFNMDEIINNQEVQEHNPPLAIKIVSILGGIIAGLIFLGFLFVFGALDSPRLLLIPGLICLAGSLMMSRTVTASTFYSFIFVFFGIGFLLIMMFFADDFLIDNKITIICYPAIALGILSLVASRHFIIVFSSVLIINSSLLALFSSNLRYDLYVHGYVALLTIFLVYLCLNEGGILSRKNILSSRYNPLLSGIIISWLAGLVILSVRILLPDFANYRWLSSIMIIAGILYIVSLLLDKFEIKKPSNKISIYLLCLLCLIPTALSPGISGALLLILLGYYINYKSAYIIGILAFIYFIGQYYYDLNLTLLTKSLLLMSSGVFFLVLYFLGQKILDHEKI